MSKGRNKEIVDETTEDNETLVSESDESVDSKSKADKVSDEPKAKDKAARNDDRRNGKDKDAKKKKKEPSKAKRRAKDFFSELKKVTWPSFTKVLKKTGVVLVVTLCFLLVMMAFDAVLGLMYKGLISGLGSDTSTTEAVTAAIRLGASLFGGGSL